MRNSSILTYAFLMRCQYSRLCRNGRLGGLWSPPHRLYNPDEKSPDWKQIRVDTHSHLAIEKKCSCLRSDPDKLA
jgi:hypothetical protein